MKIFFSLFLFFLSSNLLGDESKISYIEIESDELIIRENLLLSEFVGNVYAKNDVNHFWGDKIIINYSTNKKIELITIIGNVIIKRLGEKLTGDKAIYNLPLNKITVNGNVSIIRDKNMLNGDELIIDLITSTSIIKANKNKQVSAKVIK
jgi:lipopolysaccharide transport protein LptA